MSRAHDPDTQAVIRLLVSSEQAERDRAVALEQARVAGQREIQEALSSQRRDTDTVAGLLDRARRLDSDVNRCVVRAGVKRPQPSPGRELTLSEAEAAVESVTRELRSLRSRLDWLERNPPQPAAAPAPAPPSPAVAPPQPTAAPATTTEGPPSWVRPAVIAAVVLVALLVLLLVVL